MGGGVGKFSSGSHLISVENNGIRTYSISTAYSIAVTIENIVSQAGRSIHAYGVADVIPRSNFYVVRKKFPGGFSRIGVRDNVDFQRPFSNRALSMRKVPKKHKADTQDNG